MLGREASSPGSMVSSFTRHLYRHRRVTPNSCVNSLTSSQVLRRSTVTRWNFREYRFRFTLQPFPCKVCPSWLSHFKGAVHPSGGAISVVTLRCVSGNARISQMTGAFNSRDLVWLTYILNIGGIAMGRTKQFRISVITLLLSLL